MGSSGKRRVHGAAHPAQVQPLARHHKQKKSVDFDGVMNKLYAGHYKGATPRPAAHGIEKSLAKYLLAKKKPRNGPNSQGALSAAKAALVKHEAMVAEKKKQPHKFKNQAAQPPVRVAAKRASNLMGRLLGGISDATRAKYA